MEECTHCKGTGALRQEITHRVKLDGTPDDRPPVGLCPPEIYKFSCPTCKGLGQVNPPDHDLEYHLAQLMCHRLAYDLRRAPVALIAEHVYRQLRKTSPTDDFRVSIYRHVYHDESGEVVAVPYGQANAMNFDFRTVIDQPVGDVNAMAPARKWALRVWADQDTGFGDPPVEAEIWIDAAGELLDVVTQGKDRCEFCHDTGRMGLVVPMGLAIPLEPYCVCWCPAGVKLYGQEVAP